MYVRGKAFCFKPLKIKDLVRGNHLGSLKGPNIIVSTNSPGTAYMNKQNCYGNLECMWFLPLNLYPILCIPKGLKTCSSQLWLQEHKGSCTDNRSSESFWPHSCPSAASSSLCQQHWQQDARGPIDNVPRSSSSSSSVCSWEQPGDHHSLSCHMARKCPSGPRMVFHEPPMPATPG